MLKKEEKEKIINEIAEYLAKSTIVIATDYRGLTAKEMVKLRRQLREQGIDYRVSKNTLTKFAAEKTDHHELNKLLTGPLALAFGYDDIVKPAKIISDFIRTSGSNLQIRGGILGNKFLTPQEIEYLATIPSKEVLISKLVGQLAAPLQLLHYVLSSPINKLLYILNARCQQTTET